MCFAENTLIASEDVSAVYRFADIFSNQLAALLSDDHSEVSCNKFNSKYWISRLCIT